MHAKRFITHLMLLAALLTGLLLPFGGAIAQGPETDYTALIDADDVMQHIAALAVDIGARPMGSEAEQAAADYIAAAFESYGYIIEIQEFETTPPFPIESSDANDGNDPKGTDANTVTSRNVIATRLPTQEPSSPDEGGMIVIGAHMDSVRVGTGASDNASGVAVILAAAEAVADLETPYTLVFVAFGAEENGHPPGADAFVERLRPAIGDVIAMINVDTVGIGTHLYVYAGAEIGEEEDGTPIITGGSTAVRDLALSLAETMNLPFQTSPAETWNGFTGDWSDHYAFVQEGIPVAYFEAWDWSIGDDLWWGQETPDGDFLHTPNDVYENIVPEKVEMTAELVAATAAALAQGEN